MIVAERTWTTFDETRGWARDAFMSVLTAAVAVTYPTFVGPARDAAIASVRLDLYNDALPVRPMIGLNEQPLMTICMAPSYPRPHPRFAPAAALVLVYAADVEGLELPAVHRAMTAQHGYLYDANDLVLRYPRSSDRPTPDIAPPM